MFLNFYPSSLFYFELTPVTGGGNGNPLQYSCLENSVDGEPGGVRSMGSRGVKQYRVTNTHTYKRKQLRNSEVGEMCRTRHEEMICILHALSRFTILPKFLCVHQP